MTRMNSRIRVFWVAVLLLVGVLQHRDINIASSGRADVHALVLSLVYLVIGVLLERIRSDVSPRSDRMSERWRFTLAARMTRR